MARDITRKSFLQGAALTAVGVAGMGLFGASALAAEQGFDESVDLVVIGSGLSGLSAAVNAADNGVENILIVEKMGAIGGTSCISQGLIAGYNTKIQTGNGYELDPEDLYKLIMGYAKYHLDPQLTRITVEESSRSIDWLMEVVGVPFEADAMVGYGPYQMMHTVTGGGAGFREPFQAALEQRGVRIYVDCPAKALLRAEDGSFAGLMAEKDGAEYRIGAKACVIASGGYAANPELAGRLNPCYRGTYHHAHPACTGDGLVMGSNFGAGVSNPINLMAILKDYEGMELYQGNSGQTSVNPYMSSSGMIFVGKEGKRFMNEKAGGYMNQDLNQPVLDQMHKDELPYIWIINDQKGIDEKSVTRANGMEFTKADTLEELAALTGIDAAGLAETVAHWNEMCAAGVDADFNRSPMASLDTPPYYAISVTPALFITYGGLMRNENAELLSVEGQVLEGLYCCGEVSCNSAYMGFTLSNACTWGRRAGESAAKYIKA